MKYLIVSFILCGSAFAKQPIQPIVVDGSNHEWRLVQPEPLSFEIGRVHSFRTDDFLYLSIEVDENQPSLMLGLQDNSNKIKLDIKSNSGAIYLGRFGLRLPVFDCVLGIESAIKENNIEVRIPLAIFNSDITNRDFRIKVSNGEWEKFQPEPLLQNQKDSPWTVGGVSKLNAIIQQETEGELHIRLMEDQVSPLSAVQHIAKWELAESVEILNQIKDSDQNNLKSWALIALAEVTQHMGDLEQSNRLRRQAINTLDEKSSIARIQESVRLRMTLKEDPVTIIKFVGDLSSASIDTRYRVGRLWTLVGNYSKAAKVFESIIEDNPNEYHPRRAQRYLDNIAKRENGDRLYSTYQLVADRRWFEVASIYAQAREDDPRFMHELVRMLHRLNAYNQVFIEYLKIIE